MCSKIIKYSVLDSMLLNVIHYSFRDIFEDFIEEDLDLICNKLTKIKLYIFTKFKLKGYSTILYLTKSESKSSPSPSSSLNASHILQLLYKHPTRE
jgi:hypothetical protein